MTERLVEFLRKRDYLLIKELSEGSSGKTVLLKDDLIDQLFVCKKYHPYIESARESLYENFVREIKLMLFAYHPNVVRLYQYYLYPEQYAGFILMEYIEGQDIFEHLSAAPERASDIFLQVIEGFCHLESSGILHRDIRPTNILVRSDGTAKIIDLGFGKRVRQGQDYDRSAALNLWCAPPDEFHAGVYTFQTEVYFVGKLFEELITDLSISDFKFKHALHRMCKAKPSERIPTFAAVRKEMLRSDKGAGDEFDFSEQDLMIYRNFSEQLKSHITKIRHGVKYIDDPKVIISRLEEAYRCCMLEEYSPDAAPILRAFLAGMYWYHKANFPVPCLKSFIDFLKSCSYERQRIVLANLHSNLDAIERHLEPDDEIPF
jgi:eukaryotic-like serine/threonine-protein kinase